MQSVRSRDSAQGLAKAIAGDGTALRTSWEDSGLYRECDEEVVVVLQAETRYDSKCVGSEASIYHVALGDGN